VMSEETHIIYLNLAVRLSEDEKDNRNEVCNLRVKLLYAELSDLL
jgi:hypothetical protein